jgi:uncharacterized protein YdbL (DUF1318 family)
MSLRRQVKEVPEEKIAALADEIEDLVLNTSPESPAMPEFDATPDVGEGLDEFSPMELMISLDEIRQKAPALAELNMDNDIVLAAIRGRIFRRPAVREFEQRGCVGENRSGLLQYLGNAVCTGDRYEKRRASYAVLTDNRDRRSIYQQVIETNDLSSSDIGKVQEIFAQAIHKRAWAGTPLQMPDGAWERR